MATPRLSERELGYREGYEAGMNEACFNHDQQIDKLKAELRTLKRRLVDSGR